MLAAARNATLTGRRPQYAAKRENTNTTSVGTFTCVIPDAGDGAKAGQLAIAFFAHAAGNLTTPSGWDALRGQAVATDGTHFAALQAYVKKLVSADLGATLTVPNSGSSPYAAAILTYQPVKPSASPWGSEGMANTTGEASSLNYETLGAASPNNRPLTMVSAVIAYDVGNSPPTITPSIGTTRSNQAVAGAFAQFRLLVHDDTAAVNAARSATFSGTSLAVALGVPVLG